MSLNPLRWFVKDQAEEWGIGDDNVLRAFYGALAAVSSSGIRVTQESALRSTAVLACLIVRAESFSSLPVDLVRRAGRFRIPEEQHPAYRLLAIGPNDFMTSGEFWRWKQLTEDITGNAYARVVWKGFEPVEIWPLYGVKPTLVVGGVDQGNLATGERDLTDVSHGRSLARARALEGWTSRPVRVRPDAT